MYTIDHNLSITKDVDTAIAFEGDEIVYTLAWTHTGQSTAINAQITDVIPAHLT